jgi:hypothetical protein
LNQSIDKPAAVMASTAPARASRAEISVSFFFGFAVHRAHAHGVDAHAVCEVNLPVALVQCAQAAINSGVIGLPAE